MRREFRREKPRIRPRDDKMHSLPQKAVHKKLPGRDILYLVKKQVFKRTVNLVCGLKYIIEILCFQVGEGLVVEVDVAETHIPLCERHTAQHGLSTSPDANDDLRHVRIKINLRDFAPFNQRRIGHEPSQFLLLTFQYLNIVTMMHGTASSTTDIVARFAAHGNTSA